MSDTQPVSAWNKVERAIPVLTFLVVIIGGIWFGGGEWRSLQDKVSKLVSDYSDISDDLTAMRERMEAIERANATRRGTATPPPTDDRIPRFEQEWSSGR